LFPEEERKILKKALILILIVLIAIAGFVIIGIYKRAPANKVDVTSQLVMLGDFDNDRSWTERDAEILTQLIAAPYAVDTATRYKADINRNGRIEAEDLFILNALFTESDPYLAAETARLKGQPFPRPRELFVYLPEQEYLQPPVVLVGRTLAANLPVGFIDLAFSYQSASVYEAQLLDEIRDELIRLGAIYTARKEQLTEVERSYLLAKLQQCELLFNSQEFYPLLLTLIGLVEDGETLYYEKQDPFVKEILFFRDDLRELIESPFMAQFVAGEVDRIAIYHQIEAALNARLGIELKLATLDPPRDYTYAQNYLDRVEWQKHKGAVQQAHFKRLILYAQHDRRYLRAVSRTSPKHQDRTLKNHNLPMVLLFREALQLMDGDKKAAVALLDEAIRVPMAWAKSIPRELLPKSLALENFLLPGNKEDGADKSRHWNVFGGVAIYKSPEEALVLALKREIQDLKDSGYKPEAMDEFIRDTIANINGIYYVHSVIVPD
jgi:hypothetical protein